MSAVAAALFAFIGSLVGVYISNHLDAARKRREVRRGQIEKFAEALTDDEHWLHKQSASRVFGDGSDQAAAPPYEKARAIYGLYFRGELANTWGDFIQARHAHDALLDEIYLTRIKDAKAATSTISLTLPNADLAAQIRKTFMAYYNAQTDCLAAAAKIVEETIPARSAISTLLDASTQRLKQLRNKSPS